MPRRSLRVWDALLAVGTTGLVGLLDYATGVELRVFPLYFVPVGLIAWRSGRAAGIALACLGIATWELSNRLAGMRYDSRFVEVWNVLVQWGALVAFGVLNARLGKMVLQERTLSRVDALTGVANTRGFFDALTSEVKRARRHGRPLTLAYVDLDNFKQVNDRHGHQAGDDVLVLFANLLRQGSRDADRPARLGGDEFALLLPETTAEGARTLLDRLQRGLRAEMAARGWPVTASVGAVAFTAVPESEDEIVRQADAVMYEVKQSGKNAIRVVEVPAQAAVSEDTRALPG
jgi:diguanylate cyclase (GGDEF)-like protein